MDKKMYEILLIEPHQIQYRESSTRVMNVAQSGKYPLSILSIGTYIQENSSLSVKLLDYSSIPFNEAGFIEKLKNYSPKVIGISANSYKIDSVLYFLKLCKKYSTAVTVVGGYHLYIVPEVTLSMPEIEFIIVGDGEIPFLKLCEKLLLQTKAATGEDIIGVYSKEDLGKRKINPYIMENLDSLPIPDPRLIDNYEKIYLSPLTRRSVATIVKSRGCPFNCAYCCSTAVKFRTLSVERTLEYVKYYLDMGIREIEFYDDTFNHKVKFINEFLDGIVEKKLDFEWAIRGLKLTKMTNELSIRMKNAGLRRVQVGIESGSNRVLKLMKRNTTKEEMKSSINCFHHAGIQIVGNFILGFPYETMEDINETIDFIFEVKPDFLAIHTFEVHPGTAIYRELMEKGLLKKDYYLEYYRNPVGPPPVVALTRTVEKSKLINIRNKVTREYYLRIAYLLQICRKIHFSQLRGVVRLGTVMCLDLVQKR